jgi:signal transduction histidine kinase/CHASE3 domain sensor protein/ActR/RegA family two-component response regulator/HPt (histidine-containing phosphotransfer) domain-containing protein
MHWISYAGYWAALVAIVLMGSSIYQTAISARTLTRLIDHAIAVLAGVSEMGESVGRVNIAQLSFLISPQGGFVERPDRAFDEVAELLGRMQRLTADDAGLQARVKLLEQRVAERRNLMRDAERLRKSGPAGQRPDAAQEDSSVAITRLLGEMRQIGLEHLATYRTEQQRMVRSVIIELATAVLICIAVMVPGYIAYSRHARGRAGAESKLRNLAESLPGAVFQYRSLPDGTGRYEFLSKGVKGLRGIDPDAGLADPEEILGTIIESDRKEFLAVTAAAEISGADVEHDFRVNAKDGQVRWLRSNASPRREKDGSVVWSGLWSDVTEKLVLSRALAESKEAAEAASRAKTTFLTTMSHEIRTPMNGVLGMLELLGRTDLNVEQRTMLQVVDDSGRGLLRIIDDILDFSKIEAGKLDLNPEPTSIAKVVKSVFAIYGTLADEKGLLLTRSVDSRISPAVMIDSLRLRQVLGNLVSNAIKFTSQGRVELVVELIDRASGSDVIRFTVKDTGIGISEDLQKHLFRPFVQAGAGTAQRFGGTGLGLVICERLVTLMGGAIGVTSEPGKGTTVMATIPAVVVDPKSLPVAGAAHSPLAPGAAAPRAVPSIAAAEASGTLLLLADDHPTNRLILQRQVNLLGYAAEVAENGFEALDKWRTGRFAMLVTDCEMPLMDGYELARNIRAAEALGIGERIPIVACTAYAVVGQAEKCLAAGMDDYLSKPVDLKRLGEKLAQWMPLAAPPLAAGRAAPIEAGQPIDIAMLDEICAGDSQMQREFLTRFRACNDDDASMLLKAVADPDWAAVASISHRMKGASRTVGATPLAGACEAIELAARASDAHAVAAGMAPFDVELVRLNEYLRERYPA